MERRSLCDTHSQINLSPEFATRAVYPKGYFISPWDTLKNVYGALHSFHRLRCDILVFFWTNYHFHVTLSPFSGAIFSPLSHIWLQDYLPIIQSLSIEIDLTLFGGSAMKVAPLYGHDNAKLKVMIETLVDGLLSRNFQSKMAECHIKCRRYAGYRPFEPQPVDGSMGTLSLPPSFDSI